MLGCQKRMLAPNAKHSLNTNEMFLI